jgi:acyl-CoA hydrolase
MVAMDEAGNPTPVPEVTLETTADQHHHEAAKRRRAFRREIEERNWTIAKLTPKSPNSPQE